MIARLLAALRSTPVRIGFLLVALGFGAWAVAVQWDSIVAAMRQLPWWTIPIAVVISVLYVLSTFEAWRVLLVAHGTRIVRADAARVFLLSQLGKYVPGGVWNVLAAAELGKDHSIPRSRSLIVMIESLLISISTGLVLGSIGLLIGPRELIEQVWWVLPLLLVFVILLIPRVLNRVVAELVRRLGRGRVLDPLPPRAVGAAVLLSVIAWVFAGLQVWVLGIGLGLESSLAALGLATTAYALAWTVGFLAVLAPAGVGVREAVLGAVLVSQLTAGATVAIVLLSRVVLTFVDVALGLAFLRKPRPVDQTADSTSRKGGDSEH